MICQSVTKVHFHFIYVFQDIFYHRFYNCSIQEANFPPNSFILPEKSKWWERIREIFQHLQLIHFLTRLWTAPCPQAPSQLGTVRMVYVRDSMSACHLLCKDGVYLFLAGWNIIAPRADSDKWWCGEYIPLSNGMSLCVSADRNRPCQQATRGLLLSLRPPGCGRWAASGAGNCVFWDVRGIPENRSSNRYSRVFFALRNDMNISLW